MSLIEDLRIGPFHRHNYIAEMDIPYDSYQMHQSKLHRP